MNREQWRRVKSVAGAALSEPEATRDDYVARLCQGDDELEREVRSLLSSARLASELFEAPAFSARGATVALDDATRPLSTRIGARIGSYRIIREIGRGGMGTVFLVERADDEYRQRVALKIAYDARSPSVLERFRDERQILATLDHPNIARLMDGGTTVDGLPYLVMEYVEGVPLDEYCTANRLNLNERLRLFRQICCAVDFAHRSLVVHRDLKPRNILVTDGVPKLLDFGIAKLMDHGAQESPSTGPGSNTGLLLTPAYASPEQVRREPVTTATDVYALGVILYKLLTDRSPYRLESDAAHELATAICEQEPTSPSAALREMRTGSAAAFRSPKELQGDLDTIVLKALRKEPERRYLSAQALSDDVQRYLDGQPVKARGDAVAYRLAKFITRHRAAALVAALFLASLLGAMALLVRQSRIAEAQRQRAERRFNDVRRLAGSFLFEFHDAIRYLPGSTRARELVTKRALEYLDGLAGEAADDPTLGAELARAYQKLAEVQGDVREANLGDRPGALASYRKALALQEPLVAARPLDRSLQADVARTLRGLGDIQVMMREFSSGIGSYRRALSIAETLVAAEPSDRGAQRDLALSHYRLAKALSQLNEHEGVNNALQQAIAILRPLAVDVSDGDSRLALARAQKALGLARAAQGDHKASLALEQEALRLNEALALADPLNMTIRNEVAMTHWEVGRAHRRLGNLEDALGSLRRAETITASMAATDPSNAQARWLQGLQLNFAGVVLTDMHREAEAVGSHLKALALLEGVAEADPANESYTYNVANTCQLIGDAYVAMARDNPSATGQVRAWRDAREWYRRSAAGFDGMRRRGALTGAVMKDADHVAAGLALCDRALRATAE
jgi:eukaryotic-like serine/threonine-protein kinase